MPTISMFYGIVIRMFSDDHNPPHFHAVYQGNAAMFTLDGEMIHGNMPTKQLKYIAAWAAIHEDELKANWELAKDKEELFRIDPLK